MELITNLLSGLVGAIVGAWWTNRTARGLQRENGLQEQRAAARLIVIELIHNQNILKAFHDSKAWQPNLLTRNFWESGGPRVAVVLAPEELVAIGGPYLNIQALEALAASYRARNVPEGMATDEASVLKQQALESCSSAIDALRRYAGFSEDEFDRLRKAASK